MKAIFQLNPGIWEEVQVVLEVPIPEPAKGQVLIRVEATPIHPADALLLEGKYPVYREYPVIPGFEGSGLVVKSGGGLKGWRLTKKRVAFLLADTRLQGSWAEYVICPSAFCLPIGDLPPEKASCLMMNPLTVLMFNDVIKAHKAKAIINTAAASIVGRILLNWCRAHDIVCINIVSKPIHEVALRCLGSDDVLNENDPSFDEILIRQIKRYNVTVCFDAVGGQLAAKILEAMPDKSCFYSYGALSGEPIADFDPRNLTDGQKTIEGLSTLSWLTHLGKSKRSSVYKTLLKNVGIFSSDIQAEFLLENYQLAINCYMLRAKHGKILFKPGQMDHFPTEVPEVNARSDEPSEDDRLANAPSPLQEANRKVERSPDEFVEQEGENQLAEISLHTHKDRTEASKRHSKRRLPVTSDDYPELSQSQNARDYIDEELKQPIDLPTFQVSVFAGRLSEEEARGSSPEILSSPPQIAYKDSGSSSGFEDSDPDPDSPLPDRA